MEGFNNFNQNKIEVKREDEEITHLSLDEFIELQTKDPVAYEAIKRQMEKEQEEIEVKQRQEKIENMIEESDFIIEREKKINNFAHEAGLIRKEDIDRIIIGDDGVVRYQDMTIDEWKDYLKEDGWYR